MAQMWKSQPKEVYQEWIDTLIMEASDELTDWEERFLTSIQSYLLRNGKLSESQAETLEKIYASKTK